MTPPGPAIADPDSPTVAQSSTTPRSLAERLAVPRWGALPAMLRPARELTRKAAESASESLPTTLGALDRLLRGGLPRGRLVELTGRRSSGRFSVVLAALAATTAGGAAAALVDLGDGLDPGRAAAAGADLERLLWARPRHLRQALAGAEMLLHGGFALVVLDMGHPPVPGGRGAESAWLRLARAAAAHRVALLVSSPYRASGTAAFSVVELPGGRTTWWGTGHAPRLLAGLAPRLHLKKLDNRPLEKMAELSLRADERL